MSAAPRTVVPLLDALVAAWDEADERTRRALASRLCPYLSREPEQLLTADEKARQLHRHPETIARWASEGRFVGASKDSGRWLIPADCEILPSAAVEPLEPSALSRRRRRPPSSTRSSVVAMRALTDRRN